MSHGPFDAVVIGAGPTGLACGIELHRLGLNVLLIEKGCVVNSLYHYPTHMTFFTTPELLEIGDIPMTSLNEKPTRTEALKYYRRVADYYKEPHPYFNHDVMVVGAKNSAAIAALELYWTGARVTLVHRGAAIHPHVKYWIKPNIENRIRNGEIKGYFNTRVVEIGADSVLLETPEGKVTVKNDFVFAMVGYSPDLTFLNSAGITLEPDTQKPRTSAETLESERPGVYLAGVIVAGMHTNEIFIENGRFHGRQIANAIARQLRSSG